MRIAWSSVAVATVALGLGLLSCQDPVHADAVDALGPEAQGVEEGPTHRPGQPCLTCHGKMGPGEPEFAVAGTIFADERGDAPKPGVRIRIEDHEGVEKVFVANAVGNFYVPKNEWDPIFPLKVQLELNGEIEPMNTRVGGSGACGSCHRDARRGGPDSAHVSAVYWSRP